VLGLTYKPGTDTLRRSSAVELCKWLAGESALVAAHDPAVKALPPELAKTLRLAPSVDDLLAASDAIVVATEWPAYRDITADQVARQMKTPIVVDPNRFLYAKLGQDLRVSYDAVGMPR